MLSWIYRVKSGRSLRACAFSIYPTCPERRDADPPQRRAQSLPGRRLLGRNPSASILFRALSARIPPSPPSTPPVSANSLPSVAGSSPNSPSPSKPPASDSEFPSPSATANATTPSSTLASSTPAAAAIPTARFFKHSAAAARPPATRSAQRETSKPGDRRDVTLIFKDRAAVGPSLYPRATRAKSLCGVTVNPPKPSKKARAVAARLKRDIACCFTHSNSP